MKKSNSIVLLIVCLILSPSLNAQKYLGVDYGWQFFNFRQFTHYGDWTQNAELYKQTMPFQVGISYTNTIKKFQWQTGLNYREYTIVMSLTDFYNPNLGHTKKISKGFISSQIGIPIIFNYQITKSENIILRPFAGFNFSRSFCRYCDDNYNAHSKYGDNNNQLIEPDPIESNLSEVPFYIVMSKGNGLQINMVYGLNTDFPIGKNNKNLFRISFIKGYEVRASPLLHWQVSFYDERSDYYSNWGRLNYFSLQFSYLHSIGGEKG